ncbi:MAG TPA: hypothetical protein VFQ80_18130 [Thermomicrobiales bacterium]|jgi:hypothetical protein|nr:hypothetical protein [Thermomicrobiales bacterium]
MDGIRRAVGALTPGRASRRHWAVALMLALLLALPPLAPPASAAKSDADTLALLIGRARQRPSLVGPLSGELPLEPTTVTLVTAGVSLRDFYARAAFVSPYAGADHAWDVGIAFRRSGRNDDMRLILDSDGKWYFKEGLDPPLATGQVNGLGTEAGAVTRLDLVARGDVAYFAVNGAYVDTLDLSTRAVDGDVVVGAGFYAEDSVAGASTSFAEFEVWSLAAAADDGTAVADGGEQTTADLIFDLVEQNASGVSGVVSLTAHGALTEVGVFAFNTDGSEPVELSAGTCDALGASPAFKLNPVDPDTLSGTTTIAAEMAELTDGGHAVAIRRPDDGALLACGEIPSA